MKSKVFYFLSLNGLLFILLSGGIFVLFPQQTAAQSAKPLFSDIRFESTQNLIFVLTKLNNSEPHWLILDSGASISVINNKVAHSLGLKFGRKNKINAIGGMIEYSLIKNIDFDVSGATLANKTVAAIDLSVLEPKFGRRIDGILGSEFFNRYVVEIDYVGQTLNLYDPGKFQYTDTGEIIEFELESGTPFIKARLSPKDSDFIEGKFLVDTGAISSIYINREFAERYDLLQPLGKTIPDLFTTHLGGEVTGRIGRMQKIKIGNFLLENAAAHFPEETGNEGGSLTSSTHDGIIGGEIFRKFKVILDYSRRQLILQPNKNLLDPSLLDKSGLEIVGVGADFKTIKVRKVMENSPATEAELRVEDVIVSIDGKAASELSLDAIEEMFSQEGKGYNLIILRGNQQVKTKIKLRHLI